MADLIAECIILEEKSFQNETKERSLQLAWVLYIDGASNLQESGAGLILTNLERVVAKYALRFAFEALNNQAKFGTLVIEL